MTEDVKLRRLQEIIEVQKIGVRKRNRACETGKFRLVLVEGPAKRSTPDNQILTGRTENNKRVVFSNEPVMAEFNPAVVLAALKNSSLRATDSTTESNIRTASMLTGGDTCGTGVNITSDGASATPSLSSSSAVTCMFRIPKELPSIQSAELVGQYVVVRVAEANGPTLKVQPLAVSGLQEFYEKRHLLYM